MLGANDVYNAFRRRTLPHLHSALDLLLGGYALSDTPPEEYVATVFADESEPEELLDSVGFTRGLVASMKVRSDGNVSDGSWVYRSSLLADHQLHVILHGVDEGTKVYAHWEYSWITHPYRHYLARDYSAEKGVQQTRQLLEELESRGALSAEDWTVKHGVRRKAWYADLLRAVSDTAVAHLLEPPEKFTAGLTDESSGLLQRAADRVRSG